MAEKRYYWLKLGEGFFKDKPIKKLRKLAGGDTYTVIFLKMLIKALETNGYLYYDGVEDDFASEVALEIDEDEENVKVTVNFLMSVGYLIPCEDDSFKLPHCDTMTGSETSSAARVRKHRNGQKALHCNSVVTECNTDIEKDIDIELDLEKDKELEKKKKGTKVPKEKPSDVEVITKNTVPPPIESVEQYCRERNNGINAEHFCDYYAARGWKLNNGKKMVDWQAAVRTWEGNNKKRQTEKPQSKSIDWDNV